MKKISIILGIIFTLLVIVVLIVATMVPVFVENVAFKDTPPAERAALKADYERWRTQRLALPPAALAATPFSEATRAAARTFNEQWEKLGKDAIKLVEREDKKLPGWGAPTLGGELAGFKPLTDAFVAVVRQPDYLIPAFASGSIHDKGHLPQTNFTALQASAKLLRLQARLAARDGRLAEALDTAQTLTAAARSERYDLLITQLIGIAICAIGTGTWNELVASGNDAALLRRALEAQNKLAGQFDFLADRAIPIATIDQIGILRDMKRRGVAVAYQNLTARELTGRAWAAQADYLQKIVLPAVQGDPILVKAVQESIVGYQNPAMIFGGQAPGKGGFLRSQFYNTISPIFFNIARPNSTEPLVRADVAANKLDLLRLETARKLFTLEKGKAPAASADLVPGYLPALPVDRFAANHQPFRETTNAYYSLGPDGRDNGNQVTYDPSNGTQSAGDVALGR